MLGGDRASAKFRAGRAARRRDQRPRAATTGALGRGAARQDGRVSARSTAGRRGRSTTCCPKRSPPFARPPRRTIGKRHYDVQLIGGAVLHSGKIAEMRTGEGKTLVATLPLYLNALTGKGVHSSPSTTTCRAATRVDGAGLPRARPVGRRHPARGARSSTTQTSRPKMRR